MPRDPIQELANGVYRMPEPLPYPNQCGELTSITSAIVQARRDLSEQWTGHLANAARAGREDVINYLVVIGWITEDQAAQLRSRFGRSE